MDSQPRPKPGRLILFWLASAFFSFILGVPAVTPPGNVWTLGHTIGLAILLLGAMVCARWERSRWVFFAYGGFGALPFLFILVPDSRDMMRIASSSESLWGYIHMCWAFVVFCCLACRGLATLTWKRMDERRKVREQSPQCIRCGYLLYGLSEDRCPECGTFFDGPPPPAPDAGASQV
ncbi:MAG: hypothetical protein IT449_06260 [Phycisphaerales bacterium]|nr:hypothetical protein [Phycisphaerales bacterium]